MYSVPAINVVRERNIAGGLEPGAGLTITEPSVIAGTSTTVRWEQSGIVADEYRVLIGFSAGSSEFADSGALPDISEHTFNALPDTLFNYTSAVITILFRFAGAYQQATRTITIEPREPTPQDLDPDLNWDDSTRWDDSTFWTE